MQILSPPISRLFPQDACLAIASLVFAISAGAAPPAWWSTGTPPALDPGLATLPDKNLGMANVGQAKWMVAEALRTLGTVDPAVGLKIQNDLDGIVDLTIPNPKTPEWIEKQKAPLLLGQLKAIAAPFYRHLNNAAPGWLANERTLNSTPTTGSFYPWTLASVDDANKTPAAIGQLKAVFSLHFTEDSDNNGTNDYQQYRSISKLAAHAKDALLSRITGVVPGTSTLATYSAADDVSQDYTWNSTLWCDDLRPVLNSVSVWNSKWGHAGAGTLITPRHVVSAAHYNSWMNPGVTIRFIGKSGTVYNRTVIWSYVVPNTDIEIAILDSDIPSDVTPAKILPANLSNWLNPTNLRIPVLIRNQFGEARTLDLTQFYNNTIDLLCFYDTPNDTQLALFYRELVIGDSGGSAFLIINGELALVSTWTSSFSGPAYHNKNWQSVIATLDTLAGVTTGYLPGVIDLSGFPPAQP